MSLLSDAVLAATGVITPTAPDKNHLRAASEMPPQFAQRIRALLKRNEPMQFRPRVAKRTFSHYFKALERQVSAEEVTEILDNVGDEVFAGEYLEQLVFARQLLVGSAPANGYVSLTGPIEIELNEYDKAEWWSVILMCEDPDYVGVELEQCTVSLEQTAMLRQVYPDLYNVMTQILNGAIADTVTKTPSFELHPVIEQTFRIFLGLPIDAMTESPTSPAAAEQAPTQPGAEQKIKLDRLLPPSGRTESRR